MGSVAALLLSLFGTDRFGDPVPPGVTARFGTNRLCVDRDDVRSIRFHPTRDEVYLVRDNSGEGAVLGWELPSGAVCFRRSSVRDIRFDPRGRSRALIGATESEVWDDATGRRTAVIPHPPGLTVVGKGFSGDRLFVEVYRYSEDPDKRDPNRAKVFQVADGRPTECDFITGERGRTSLSARDAQVWVADEETAELRGHSSDSGRLRTWSRLAVEPDTDPPQHATLSSDGRLAVVVQYRVDEKADRYRGCPECFIHVVETASRTLAARYAFRLDDAGDDVPSKSLGDADEDAKFGDVTVSDDGRFAAWTDRRARLLIRHLPTGRVATAPGRGYRQMKLAFDPKGKRLAVLDDAGVLRLIDPFTGRYQTTDNPCTAATAAAVSSDGSRVATGHDDGSVWMWDAVSTKPLWRTEPDGSPVREIHFNPTGATVSAVGFWGPIGVRTFDAKSGKELGPMLPYRYLRSVAVSANGRRIADLIEEKGVQEKDGWAYPLFVRTRDLATGKETGRVRLDHKLGLSNETDAVVSRDGRVMIVTHTNSEILAYDTATGKRTARLGTHDGKRISGWDVSADGRIATHMVLTLNLTNADWEPERRTVAVYDLASPQPHKPIRVIDSNLQLGRMIVSPDGRYLALSGWQSGEAFDIGTGERLRDLPGPAVAVFPDGRSALTLPGIRGAERVSLEPLPWKVAPPRKPADARLSVLWKRLAEPGTAGLDAVFELARFPDVAVPFLKAKLHAEPPDAKVVAGHLAALSSREYAEREAGTKALRAFGPVVVPALRAALKGNQTPEARSRIEKMLSLFADTAEPFTLARLQAVEALERCGTPEAKAALRAVAASPGTPWADDAARAAKR